MEIIKVAAIQLSSKQDKDQNFQKAGSLMERAVQEGARILALPENFSFLGDEREKLYAAETLESGESVAFLKRFAFEKQVYIIGGSIPLKNAERDKVTNTCLVFDPAGEIIARYDKMHLFDITLDRDHTYRESDFIIPGKASAQCLVAGISTGLSICYDLRFAELYRAYADKGVALFSIPSAFTVPTGKAHWDVLLRTRAIENQCYVIAPAQWGKHNDRRETYGHSMIIDPWGEILAIRESGEGVVCADLDMAHLRDIRQKMPVLQHRKIF